MKSQEDIRRRLEKLRMRYLKRHCAALRDKKPQNCVFNHEHTPPPSVKHDVPIEMELAPRVSTTLVVIQPDAPIRLCMYGSDNPAEWNGDLCDKDEIAQVCRKFKPKMTEEEAIESFNVMLADDPHVLEHYKDMAALQWVLGERVAMLPLSWMERLTLAIIVLVHKLVVKFRKPEPVVGVDDTIPSDLWLDDVDRKNTGN